MANSSYPSETVFHFEGCGCSACAGGPPPEEDLVTDWADSTADSDTPEVPGAAGASRTVYTADQIVAALTTSDGADGSLAWRSDAVSYSIGTGQLTPDHPEYDTEHNGYVAMDAAMEARAREAFMLWDDLIAIDLVERTDDAGAHITFNYSSNSGGSTYAQYSYSDRPAEGRADHRLTDVDLWFADSWYTQDEASDLYDGGYGMMTYLHEIGHGLGLSHPGPYNGTARFNSDATHFQDTRAYTLMSYFDAHRNGSGTDHFGTDGRAYGATPLLHDILAVQSVYGADMTTRTGDTVYGFNATANRAAFDFTANENPIVAIWDAGGIDRLDVSGWGNDQVVDLREGAFSSTGFLSENVAIAYGAVIEEAVGGSGDDLIRGNAAANRLWGGAGDDLVEGDDGQDRLYGGAGADTLDGGADSDLLTGGAGDDTVIGGAGGDRFIGGAGRDVIDGGAGRDWLTYALDGPGIEIDLGLGRGLGGQAEGDLISGIAAVAGTNAADRITGDEAANGLTGRAGDDVLSGAGGADHLGGGAGDDSLFGGTGDDILAGGAGADLLDGGTGRDRAGYGDAATAVGADLETGGFAGDALGDVYVGIEDLNGSVHDDILLGDAADNVIRGRDGADHLEGRSGRDWLFGGADGDSLDGGADGDHLWGGLGGDTLTGGQGTDRLMGEAGNDRLIGGSGNDHLWGGTGADIFVFAAGAGHDGIRDFDVAADQIVFEGIDADALVFDMLWGRARISYAPDSSVTLGNLDLVDLEEIVFLFS
ncbi:MAG: M10 family metallopeptidase C-terminal domain-containing protein [Pseudomonadota bacterium]